MSTNVISCEAISKSFSEKSICKNQSFGIHENDKIGLIGINGCGKSTFLKMLYKVEPLDSGKITIRNNTRINYLPQIPDLNPELTAYEQLYYSEHPQFMRLRKYYKLLRDLEKNPIHALQNRLNLLSKQLEAATVWKIEKKKKKEN